MRVIAVSMLLIRTMDDRVTLLFEIEQNVFRLGFKVEFRQQVK